MSHVVAHAGTGAGETLPPRIREFYEGNIEHITSWKRNMSSIVVTFGPKAMPWRNDTHRWKFQKWGSHPEPYWNLDDTEFKPEIKHDAPLSSLEIQDGSLDEIMEFLRATNDPVILYPRSVNALFKFLFELKGHRAKLEKIREITLG